MKTIQLHNQVTNGGFSNTFTFSLLWFAYILTFLLAVFGVYKTYTLNSYPSASPLSVTNEQNQSSQVLASFTSTDVSLPDIEKVFELVNEQRENAGLPPLVRNSVLTKVAQARAQDMIDQNYYAHKDKNGLYFFDHINALNYPVGFSCENLDLSFSSEPKSYVSDWMRSTKGHKECIINSEITDAGYALVPFMPPRSAQDIGGYLVVAIHAEIR